MTSQSRLFEISNLARVEWMGIQGLLKQLEPLATHINLPEAYRGKTIAIDISVWLHRGAYGCATDLVLGNDTNGYLAYIIARVLSLRRHGVNVICVFDGLRTSLKSETANQRRSTRAEYISQGMAAYTQASEADGDDTQKSLLANAGDNFRKGVSVTEEMTLKTISALRAQGFQTVVSPSEADVQLAYLCKIGVADAVLTEDSDVMVYSVASSTYFPALYKYDHWTLHAQVCSV